MPQHFNTTPADLLDAPYAGDTRVAAMMACFRVYTPRMLEDAIAQADRTANAVDLAVLLRVQDERAGRRDGRRDPAPVHRGHRPTHTTERLGVL